MKKVTALDIFATNIQSGRTKEFLEKVGERIVSLRSSVANQDVDPMLLHLLENTLMLNLELYHDLAGEDYDKRYS